MRATVAGALCAVLLAAPGCRKTAPAGTPTLRMPRGDAIWLRDPAAAAEAGLEDTLQRLGAVALFLPAGEVDFEARRWRLREAPAPSRPMKRAPVVFVLRAGAELSGALMSAEGIDAITVGRAIAAELKPLTASGGPYGRVSGVHLDFPFAPAGAGRYGALVTALRAALPPGTFVSITLDAVPASEAERKRLDPLLAAADALLAFVFRDGKRLDAAAVDALRRPWWPAFEAAGHGERSGPDGAALGSVDERFLDPLSGDPHVEFGNDLSGIDATLSAFHLRAREAVRLDGLTLSRGDHVAFRLPSETEMLFQLGSTLAGKHFALGRVIVFEGSDETKRLFPLAAFEDILLGRTLAPSLQVAVAPLPRAISVAAVNRAAHATIVSRQSNWVEVDLAPARPGDVQLGGFDRYEVYDSKGRPVTPGRATRVRLFETVIAPWEAISPARILVRDALPRHCCRSRVHMIAAAGPEVATDWTEPPPEPTPTAPPKAKKRK